MTNEEIVHLIQNGIETQKNQEVLWQQNIGYVFRLIRNIGVSGSDIVDDLKQQAFLGMMNATINYNLDGEGSFINYAKQFIIGAMYRYMGETYNMFHIPQYMRRRLRRYSALLKKHQLEQLSDDYLMKQLGICRSSLDDLQKTIQRIRTYSLDEPVLGSDDNTALINFIESDENLEEAVLCSVYETELHNALIEALSILDDTTRMMIHYSYFQGFSQKKISSILGCSQQYILRRIERGFNKILKSNYRENLESFMWDGYKYTYENLDNSEDSTECSEDDDMEYSNSYLI